MFPEGFRFPQFVAFVFVFPPRNSFFKLRQRERLRESSENCSAGEFVDLLFRVLKRNSDQDWTRMNSDFWRFAGENGLLTWKSNEGKSLSFALRNSQEPGTRIALIRAALLCSFCRRGLWKKRWRKGVFQIVKSRLGNQCREFTKLEFPHNQNVIVCHHHHPDLNRFVTHEWNFSWENDAELHSCAKRECQGFYMFRVKKEISFNFQHSTQHLKNIMCKQ